MNNHRFPIAPTKPKRLTYVGLHVRRGKNGQAVTIMPHLRNKALGLTPKK